MLFKFWICHFQKYALFIKYQFLIISPIINLNSLWKIALCTHFLPTCRSICQYWWSFTSLPKGRLPPLFSLYYYCLIKIELRCPHIRLKNFRYSTSMNFRKFRMIICKILRIKISFLLIASFPKLFKFILFITILITAYQIIF